MNKMILLAAAMMLSVSAQAVVAKRQINCPQGTQQITACMAVGIAGKSIVDAVTICRDGLDYGMSTMGRINGDLQNKPSNVVDAIADVRVGATTFRAILEEGDQVRLTVGVRPFKNKKGETVRKGEFFIPMKTADGHGAGSLTKMECK